jgi:4,5-dihydroxyphthalate decarboxylase
VSRLKLSLACGFYDRTDALRTGDVKVDGIDVDFILISNPREIFDRMGGKQEFDVSEFSSSEYISRLGRGDRSFVAIPVFPSRVFRHGYIYINRKAGIREPKDIAGKRVGVPVYTMTAAVFIRGLLGDEYGVDFSNVEWIEGAINDAKRHGDPTILPTAKKLSIGANKSGKSLSTLLADGEIQAMIGTGAPDSFGRNPDVVRLYPDYRAAEMDYYRRTKIFPIMHSVVIRRDIVDKHPFVAQSLFDACNRAKAVAQEKLSYFGTLRYMLPWMMAEVDDVKSVFGDDCWPYGVEANRPTLTALVRYLEEQGIVAKAPKVDELFAPVKAH